jgi:hypothetical protein
LDDERHSSALQSIFKKKLSVKPYNALEMKDISDIFIDVNREDDEYSVQPA